MRCSKCRMTRRVFTIPNPKSRNKTISLAVNKTSHIRLTLLLGHLMAGKSIWSYQNFRGRFINFSVGILFHDHYRTPFSYILHTVYSRLRHVSNLKRNMKFQTSTALVIIVLTSFTVALPSLQARGRTTADCVEKFRRWLSSLRLRLVLWWWYSR